MRLLGIYIADKPRRDKRGEGVVPKEKLWIIELRQACHLRCLDPLDLILNSHFGFGQCMYVLSGVYVNLHLLDGTLNPCLERCLGVSDINKERHAR
jgi:hypothetical protein